jgi:hypothetical protein
MRSWTVVCTGVQYIVRKHARVGHVDSWAWIKT